MEIRTIEKPAPVPKRGRGRPALKTPKFRKNFRLPAAALEIIEEVRVQGGYTSQDAVIEDILNHAMTCQYFPYALMVPPEELDLSDL